MCLTLVFACLFWAAHQASGQARVAYPDRQAKRITAAQKKEAAAKVAKMRAAVEARKGAASAPSRPSKPPATKPGAARGPSAATSVASRAIGDGPTGLPPSLLQIKKDPITGDWIPDYFGWTPNWAFSPLPQRGIASIAVDQGGSGYVNPVVTITDDYSAVATGATATATVDATGAITAITVTAAGTGYIRPHVAITDTNVPPGSGAMATAVLGGPVSGGIRKFVDPLPGLVVSADGTYPAFDPTNMAQKFIPVAYPDSLTFLDYDGSDFYAIALVEWSEKMHSDLPPTKIRGYVQLNMDGKGDPILVGGGHPLTYPDGTAIRDANGVQYTALTQPHYLGPTILAEKDKPVRIKFLNLLPFDTAPPGPGGTRKGDLFIPVDTSILGSGETPDGELAPFYTQNRANLHLHGGRSPWISDGTPHQWIIPSGETSVAPEHRRGPSAFNVPDMADPGPGGMTYYYTNQQSARLLFYHDHAWGITRLNVYVGNAAGYLITDETEKSLIHHPVNNPTGPIPADQIPLIIQDKTFVDADTISCTDPLWQDPKYAWGTGTTVTDPGGAKYRTAKTGDFWWPHVYMPAQNPFNPDLSGVNAMGRWHYGPWFWPPTVGIAFPPVTNPYYDPVNAPWESPEMPGTPHPSWGAEAFLDTPVVNGTAYPVLNVDPKAYRFRILNAAHDRFVNLQLYQAMSQATMWNPDGTLADANVGELEMIPAEPSSNLPPDWPADGREGGVPNPTASGPAFIQIGNECGFLPAPVLLKNRPVVWNNDVTTFNAGNVSHGTLMIGPAERADVIVDFTQFAGKTLILYNDAPAPWPALDPHYDYYSGAPDISDIGGSPFVLPGYGPNTRTVMMIKVSGTPGTPTPNAYDAATLTALQNEFASQRDATGALVKAGVFERSQDPIIVAQAAYSSAYGHAFPAVAPYWGLANIFSTTIKFDTVIRDPNTGALSFQRIGDDEAAFPLKPKAIQDEMGETFDEYGRMSAKLGLELPFTTAGIQTFVLQNYIDPPTEVLQKYEPLSPVLEDGSQIWKITHNGVDTHPVHFHLFDVQVINRVGWDGFIRLPDPNELGWKETVRVSPLEDTIVALRPIMPRMPFGLPDSVRRLNPARPLGDTTLFTNLDPLTGQPRVPPDTNIMFNFGWEYVFHCHILSHEEMDMMRPISFQAPRAIPQAPVLSGTGSAGNPAMLTWTDGTPWGPGNHPATTMGNPAGEVGFRIERATPTGEFAVVGRALANAIAHNDLPVFGTYRYRVVAWNAAGESVSNIISLTAGVPPPAAPSGLTATPSSSGVTPISIALSWTDNANNETGFTIERATNAGFTAGLTTFNVAGANVTTYVDSGLPPLTTFYYRVRAGNAIGNSAWSNVASATTSTPPPAAPSGLAASATTTPSLRVNLTWTDNANNETGFTIQRSTNAGFTNVTTLNVGANTTSYADTTVASSTGYFYRVRASNTGGNSAWSNTATVTTPSTLPAAPSGLAAAVATTPSLRVNLTWTDNATNETGFTIQRANNASFTSGQRTYTVGANATSYANTTVNAGSTYYYRVRATNATGNSAWSNTVSIAVSTVTPPAAPSGLTATYSATPTPRVNLSWTDNSNNETSFRVERQIGGGTFAAIAVLTTGATTYADTTVVAGTVYGYRVVAVNAAGSSPPSNVATVTVPVPQTGPTSPSSLELVRTTTTWVMMRWQDNSNNEQGFYVERSTNGGTTWTRVAQTAANTASYRDTAVVRGTTYRYRVQAFNGAGVSGYTNTITARP